MSIVVYQEVAKPIVPTLEDLPLLALFARGEQGAWYDPGDFYNYAMERGEEIVTNQDFSAGLTSEYTTVAATHELVDGVIRATCLEVAGRTEVRLSGLKVGGVYEIRVVARAVDGADSVIRTLQGFSPSYSSGTLSTDFREYVIERTATSSEVIVRVYPSNGGTPGLQCEVASYSVRELSGLSRATMFQDAEGTTPVTSVEQPVGLILDKSGNGNHASQVTVPARPYLSARVNLLNYSNDLTNAYWIKAVGLTPNQPGPFGQNDATLLTVETYGSYRRIYRANVTADGEKCVQSIYAKAGTTRYLNHHSGSGAGVSFDLLDGVVTVAPAIAATTTAKMTPVGDGWWRCEIHYLQGYTSAYWMVTTNGGTTGEEGDSIYVSRLQTETGFVATKYQDVRAATDYDWQGWPLYLQRDGVDDVLASGETLTLNDNWHLIHAGQYPEGTSTGITSGICIAPNSENAAATNHFGIGYRPSALYAGAMLRNRIQDAPLVTTVGTQQELAGGPHIIEGWANGSVVAHSVDGGAEVSKPTDPAYDYGPAPASLHLAGARSTLAATNPMRDYTVLAVQRQLTPTERITVREILNDKIKVPE